MSVEEAAEIAAVESATSGRAMRGDMPATVREGLASKGFIRLDVGRWQLTLLGFTCTVGF